MRYGNFYYLLGNVCKFILYQQNPIFHGRFCKIEIFSKIMENFEKGNNLNIFY